MRTFHDMSIRRKQMLIIMLISTVALVLACAIFVAYDVVNFRKDLVKKVSVLAEAIGNNCTATMEYNDPKTAEDTLSALRAEPGIVSACIYDRKGSVFAVYTRQGATAIKPPPLQAAGHEFKDDSLHLFHPITQQGETIGTIFVASDLTELHERLARYPAIVCGMLAVALVVVLILSNRLQRVISDPILHLAQVARSVALDKNYSVRAKKQSADELGQLIDGFNDMLTQIQERDGALLAAHDHLERRVEERTEELRQSQGLYHSLVENLPVHVYRKDEAGRFVFVNSHFCQFHGLTAQEILGKTIFEITADKDLAERYAREDDQMIQNGESIEMEEQRRDAKDNLTYLQVIKSPVFASDGKVVGTQGMSFDITERKQAEAKLQDAHRDLVKTSRQAGMAEVATSVLHNVGNVLNSVNITTELITENLRRSRVAYVARVVALMRQQPDLGQFMTRDPKGQQIPDYLEQLGKHLAEEQAAFVRDLASLKNNIDHIKNIVAMQQGYAKVSGATEIVKVTDLVEDALRIDVSELERHGVQLVRDYAADIPGITVDKHKVLQILVNLIRNARHACDDSGNEQKRLTVQVRQVANRVRIAVTDNGVGILPENLTRIFNHGFTTRKSGHGFGLHSGALAAKETGGLLTAHSDGPGKGATFTLELPLQPTQTHQERQSSRMRKQDGDGQS
jgi:PAS domain S-box-containing protein